MDILSYAKENNLNELKLLHESGQDITKVAVDLFGRRYSVPIWSVINNNQEMLEYSLSAGCSTNDIATTAAEFDRLAILKWAQNMVCYGLSF